MLCFGEPEFDVVSRTVTHVLIVIFVARAVTVVLFISCAKGSNSGCLLA